MSISPPKPPRFDFTFEEWFLILGALFCFGLAYYIANLV